MLIIRLLTLPLLPFYALIVFIRNKAFDNGLMKSNQFDIPVIGVGNLSVGGTGKTPMVEYLIRLIKDESKVGVISRGYGRNTRDYMEVMVDSFAKEVGDEPLQIKQKFGDAIRFAVERERIYGITRLLTDHPDRNAILLDDSYQHRSVVPGVNVLLTTYQEPYYSDRLIPVGDLREFKAGRKRADLVVVTKCPTDISEKEMQDVQSKLDVNVPVAFSCIEYGDFKSVENKVESPEGKILLVTGIAEPDPLHKELVSRGLEIEHVKFNDHHKFTDKDIQRIRDLFGNFDASMIVTTEKDFTRLRPWVEELQANGINTCYLEIRTKFIRGGEVFDKTILQYVRANKDYNTIPEGEDELQS